LGVQASTRPLVRASLGNLGITAEHEGNPDDARQLIEECLTLMQSLGDDWGAATSLLYLGVLAQRKNDYPRAGSLFESCLEIRKRIGDHDGIGGVMHSLAEVALAENDGEKARRLYAESVVIARQVKNPRAVIYGLEGLARVNHWAGDSESAVRLFGAGQQMRDALQLPVPPSEIEEHQGYVDACRAALGENVFAGAWSEGSAMSVEEAVGLAIDG